MKTALVQALGANISGAITSAILAGLYVTLIPLRKRTASTFSPRPRGRRAALFS